MKNKNLAIANGILGIVGGSLLLIVTLIFWGLVAQASQSSTYDSYAAGYQIGNQYSVFILISLIVASIIIFGLFSLGIIGLNYYKLIRMSKAPHILLIIGSSLSIIPLIGKIIGAILLIIGGILYLVSLKNIEDNQVVRWYPQMISLLLIFLLNYLDLQD